MTDVLCMVMRDNTQTFYCAAHEVPVCSTCKAHAGWHEGDDGDYWNCDEHGFVCWGSEP